MSTVEKENYSRTATVSKSTVVDDFFYDIDSVLSEFKKHWDKYNEEEPPEQEGIYRGFDKEENNLYFEITAEGREKAVIKLEYTDSQGDGLEDVEGKLEKVWNDRIETVLERGLK